LSIALAGSTLTDLRSGMFAIVQRGCVKEAWIATGGICLSSINLDRANVQFRQEKGSMDHKELIGKVIELAVENVASGGGPFGALVVRNGQIVASGVNRVTPANDPTAHAEVIAIRSACRALSHFELAGCDIYSSCEPCPMCLGAIYWARAERVYFAARAEDASDAGFDDSMIRQQMQLPREMQQIHLQQVLDCAWSLPFRAWLGKADKVLY